MDTDRNLLFGVLALQVDLITGTQFAEACSAWAANKSGSLAELLVARGWLRPADRTDVEKLLERKLNKHLGNARASLAEVTTDGVRQSLAGIADPDIRVTLDAPTPPPGHVLVATTDYVPETGDRYTRSRLHATGGIGRVWLAHDAHLGRDVALKELRPERACQPTIWARFLKEAQITGQLEHPGIVPVYEVGRQTEDHAPFYTMRFVRGRTLSEAAKTYHARRSRGEAGPLELRDLQTAVIGVCNAIAYAHSRGVLHRDLKPQNAILGDYGEVIVLDWGLAKVIGEAEGDALPVAVETDDDTGSRTVAGQVLGTPAYMAPEQAEGRLDLLDARTDVYGLGAILYEVLAGKPPFVGSDTATVLRRVTHEPPIPPRAVVSEVSRSLNAVCMKALAKRPVDRYASVKDLAEDLKHILADEPVTACRERFVSRAGRWIRRHRTFTAATAVLLIVGTVGFGLSTLFVNRQRARAEENARIARGAVDDMYTQVAEKWLAQEPRLEDVQREFLEKALRFYEREAQSEDPSAEVRREVGKAARRAADIQARLGDSATADASFHRAVSVLESIPQDDQARLELAVTYNGHGWFLWTHGRSADEAVQRALEIGEELVDRRPDILLARIVVAGAHSRLGIIYAARGRFAEAEASHRRCLAIRTNIGKNDLLDPADLAGEARTHANLVRVLRQVGRFREADAESNRAVELVAALVAEFPRNPVFRSDLVSHLDERANLLDQLGRRDEAVTHLRRSCMEADRLLADFPGSIEHQLQASVVHRDLANLVRDQGNPGAAEPDLRRAVEVSIELTRQYPDMPNHWRTLAVNRANLAGLLHSIGRAVDAEPEYDRALAIIDNLVTRFPDFLDYRLLQTLYRSKCAFLLRVTGKFPESDIAYGRAITEVETLVRDFPGLPEPRASLASVYRQAAEVRGLLKPPQDPNPYFDRAIREAEDLANEYDIPAYHMAAASSLAEQARYALNHGSPDRVRTLLERSNRHLEPVLRAIPDDNESRYNRLRNFGLLAQLRAKAGDLAGADAMAREVETVANKAIEHYNAACSLSLAATAVQESATPLAERDLLAISFANRAIAQLRKSIVAGYRNASLIKIDPDLNAIRRRDDFQKLLAELETRLKAESK
jgi:tetratricopeptide (TPR) repeat protein/tRNA A-37 threonylcarbamoyl transferase component Bud32